MLAIYERLSALRAAAEDKAMDYMKKLHANIGQYTGTAPQAIQLVGQGQFIGAPNWSHDILTAKSQGQPIDNLNPQPTGFEVGSVSIIKGEPSEACFYGYSRCPGPPTYPLTRAVRQGQGVTRQVPTGASCPAKWGMTSRAKRSIIRRVLVWL